MSDRSQEVADELIGTYRELHDVAEPHELEDFEFRASLGEYAMCCKNCYWWDAPEDMDTTGDEPECAKCSGDA